MRQPEECFDGLLGKFTTMFMGRLCSTDKDPDRTIKDSFYELKIFGTANNPPSLQKQSSTKDIWQKYTTVQFTGSHEQA